MHGQYRNNEIRGQTSIKIMDAYNNIKKSIENMKNYGQEICQTSDSQPYHLQQAPLALTWMSDMSFSSFHGFSYLNPTNETSHFLNYNIRIEQQFTTKTMTNIVLSTKSLQKSKNLKNASRGKEVVKEGKKANSKLIQKQSRNVTSNVLRIFFKSVLQLGIYDGLILKILQKSKAPSSKESFYAWLLSFNINFKNYIRATQMKKILNVPGNSEYKKTLLILLRHYLSDHALTHCLTSKRIELSSLKMHLSGIKELYQESTEMKLQ